MFLTLPNLLPYQKATVTPPFAYSITKHTPFQYPWLLNLMKYLIMQHWTPFISHRAKHSKVLKRLNATATAMHKISFRDSKTSTETKVLIYVQPLKRFMKAQTHCTLAITLAPTALAIEMPHVHSRDSA